MMKVGKGWGGGVAKHRGEKKVAVKYGVTDSNNQRALESPLHLNSKSV